VHARFARSLPVAIEPAELLRALRVALDALLAEGGELAAPVERDLRALVEADTLS